MDHRFNNWCHCVPILKAWFNWSRLPIIILVFSSTFPTGTNAAIVRMISGAHDLKFRVFWIRDESTNCKRWDSMGGSTLVHKAKLIRPLSSAGSDSGCVGYYVQLPLRLRLLACQWAATGTSTSQDTARCPGYLESSSRLRRAWSRMPRKRTWSRFPTERGPYQHDRAVTFKFTRPPWTNRAII